MDGKHGIEPIVRPRRLRLEATSVCQLHCPDCPTATGEARPVLGAGHLRFENFRKLVDRNPSLVHIELSNYGELFLNPELPEIMRYAFERGVHLTADSGANMNTIRDKTLEALVKYRFRRITCSIDGASAETYSRYRVGGDFETVIANIRKIQNGKKRWHSPYPRLSWQFVVFDHNQQEIQQAREMARELGMRFRLKLPWKEGPELVQIHKGAGPASRSDYKEKYGVSYMRPICKQLWSAPQVNWDGRVLGCCRNFWGEFGGNAFEDGIKAVANSERIQYARGMLMGTNPAREDIPCTTCDLYRDLAETHRWMTPAETHIPAVMLDKIYTAGLGNKYVLRAVGMASQVAEELYFRFGSRRKPA